MNSINTFEEDDLDKDTPKVKVRRSSVKDVIKVCPHCFSPSKITNADIFQTEYACTNEECGWTGLLAIEVLQEDYKEFQEKQKQEKQK